MSSLSLLQLRRRCGSKPLRTYAGWAFLAALLLVTGCQQEKSPTAAPTPRTPREKLEALAVGLDDLLSNRRSAEGVTVQSEVTHQLIDPTSADAPPTAEITIETQRFFVLSPELLDATAESDPPDDSDEKKTVIEIEANTAIVKNREKKVYNLAYLDDRWQLKTELDDISEVILFDRALRMQ